MALADTLKNYGGSVSAATRYVGAFAGGAAFMLGLSGMSADQIKALMQSIQDAGNGLASLLTALGTLAGVLLGAYGAWKASKGQQAKALTKDGTTELKVTKDATPQLQALALDTDVKGIKPAPGLQP